MINFIASSGMRQSITLVLRCYHPSRIMTCHCRLRSRFRSVMACARSTGRPSTELLIQTHFFGPRTVD